MLGKWLGTHCIDWAVTPEKIQTGAGGEGPAGEGGI